MSKLKKKFSKLKKKIRKKIPQKKFPRKKFCEKFLQNSGFRLPVAEKKCGITLKKAPSWLPYTTNRSCIPNCTVRF